VASADGDALHDFFALFSAVKRKIWTPQLTAVGVSWWTRDWPGGLLRNSTWM
jgi:hypothetical protein